MFLSHKLRSSSYHIPIAGTPTTFTSGSGTYVCPPGASFFDVEVLGGGGGSGGSWNTIAGGCGGGGSGGYSKGYYPRPPSGSISYQVGAAGYNPGEPYNGVGGGNSVATIDATTIIGYGGAGSIRGSHAGAAGGGAVGGNLVNTTGGTGGTGTGSAGGVGGSIPGITGAGGAGATTSHSAGVGGFPGAGSGGTLNYAGRTYGGGGAVGMVRITPYY